MPSPDEKLEVRVENAQHVRFREHAKKALDMAGTGVLGTYGFTVLFGLCPPVMMYCAGKGMVHGIQHGYHWVHDHLSHDGTEI